MLSAPPAITRSLSPFGNLQAGLDDGLQSRSAAAVDLHAGNRHRQAGVQRHHTTDCGCLAVGVAMSEDHVAHHLGRDSGPVEQPLQRGDREVDGGQRFEHAAIAPDRRPQGFADNNFAHQSLTHFAETNVWVRKFE